MHLDKLTDENFLLLSLINHNNWWWCENKIFTQFKTSKACYLQLWSSFWRKLTM